MARPNLFEPDSWDFDYGPEGFDLRGAQLVSHAGGRELGGSLYELGSGIAVSPMHVHHGNEELVLAISGRPSIRTPDGERELTPGEMVAFPRGADGAHQVLNRAEEHARVLVLSTMNFPDVAERTEFGKLVVVANQEDMAVVPRDAQEAPFAPEQWQLPDAP